MLGLKNSGVVTPLDGPVRDCEEGNLVNSGDGCLVISGDTRLVDCRDDALFDCRDSSVVDFGYGCYVDPVNSDEDGSWVPCEDNGIDILVGEVSYFWIL